MANTFQEIVPINMHVTNSHMKNFTSSLVFKNTQIKLFSESSRGGLEVERPLRIQLKALVDWIPLGAILRINSDQKGIFYNFFISVGVVVVGKSEDQK